jgi:hypothetical protein
VLASASKNNQYPQHWFTTKAIIIGTRASQIVSIITHVIAQGILLANALI